MILFKNKKKCTLINLVMNLTFHNSKIALRLRCTNTCSCPSSFDHVSTDKSHLCNIELHPVYRFHHHIEYKSSLKQIILVKINSVKHLTN